ncbi:polysaccharide pyruvyl transferase family protein [Alkalitalea saponilacus]|uniref:Polysaccharide pyruvyl transferase n=1 Tax=Alkalitalea saponilacus TaxID=889453 RepID=A0A1T5FJD4_9BACT|nr:polysaccharide pyruvyl transferase family protein [Alkalitalea saponilacus]ASB49415.1 hypothetical protein CDL62_09840 [Alkalitalea saponilacus]SKB96212.1 Polysaccharide pyruvyl transferase [Alkalitalea saponilacus]
MEKKKAYLLAYQRATNYGAVLQLYALKIVLERLGVVVSVIDYVPEWMKVTMKNQPTLLSYIKRRIMSFTFNSFLRQLNLTKRKFSSIDEMKQLLPAADYYFVGSDQVWNERIMKQDLAYFLSFAPEKSVKVGYAVSMGNIPLSEEFLEDARPYIQRFDSISVRENYVSEFIANCKFELNTPVVLDPTLLLSGDDYTKVSPNKCYKQEYIAVYSCMHDQNLYELAKYLKRKTGLPLVNLGYHFKGPDKHEYMFGPGNWINRIRNAKYFITNSFHGTAFAVLFKRTFFTVPNQNHAQLGLNARFMEFLTSIELANRVVYSEQDADAIIEQYIDFDKSHSLLENRRIDALEFIKGALMKEL